MNRICIAILRFYKATISKIKPKVCRYTPSCSVYSMESFREHGFFKACWLTLTRLLRCNPWCRGGRDTVPYNFKGEIKWAI